jgi:hypothetical protein
MPSSNITQVGGSGTAGAVYVNGPNQETWMPSAPAGMTKSSPAETGAGVGTVQGGLIGRNVQLAKNCSAERRILLKITDADGGRYRRDDHRTRSPSSFNIGLMVT